MSSAEILKDKLKKRFFEVLILLATISQTQGDRIDEELYTEPQHSPLRTVFIRREVLRQLCRVCEYKKGGEAVTSMALENTPQGPVYWVSAPNVARVESFLRKVLEILRTSSRSQSSTRAALLEAFVQHAALRLNAHRRFLRKELQAAMEVLQRHPRAREEHTGFQEWIEKLLDDIKSTDSLGLCELMYKKRKEGEGDKLGELLEQLQASQPEKEALLIRHHMGRLASTVCAANILARASRDQAHLFEDFDTKLIPCGLETNGPTMPEKFTLASMATRMLSAGSAELPDLINDLSHLDRIMSLDGPSSGLVARMREQYESRSFKLRVHAELALLEAVYAANIEFYDNDRYIACSKGACYCCYHYIRHHPGRFVTPASHNKIWLNWGPPELPQTSINANPAKMQRDLLIKINHDTRADAIDAVRSKRGSRYWHPDSTTGFIASVMNLASVAGGRPRSSSSDSSSTSTSARIDLESDSSSSDEGPFLDAEEEFYPDDGGVSLISAQVSSYHI